jgi:hypothetical protein
MKTILTALAALALGGQALALPVPPLPPLPVVAYEEMMVLTPGLEYLGYSRITTIEACEDETKTDHTALLTDSDFENFERCLISYN